MPAIIIVSFQELNANQWTELATLRNQVMKQDGQSQFNHQWCPNLFLELETRALTEQFKPHNLSPYMQNPTVLCLMSLYGNDQVPEYCHSSESCEARDHCWLVKSQVTCLSGGFETKLKKQKIWLFANEVAS